MYSAINFSHIDVDSSKDKVFFESECIDIKGEGGFWDWEKQLTGVRKILLEHIAIQFPRKTVKELGDNYNFKGQAASKEVEDVSSEKKEEYLSLIDGGEYIYAGFNKNEEKIFEMVKDT